MEMNYKEKILKLIDELIKEAQEEPWWRAESALKCLKCNLIPLLKEHEVRELTMDEWREWKNNPKRNPICELWEHDTSPMWVLDPDTIHEPAFLMGKLKLFTGKPTLEQCKAVKWNE